MLNNIGVGKSEEQKAGTELARFLASKWFKELIISKYGLEHFSPITCYKGGQKISGYEATRLVDLCDAILEARKFSEKFSARQNAVGITNLFMSNCPPACSTN